MQQIHVNYSFNMLCNMYKRNKHIQYTVKRKIFALILNIKLINLN